MKYYGLRPTRRLQACNVCMEAKARKPRLNKQVSEKATQPAECLLIDTSGPFHPTPSGTRYWVEFICKYTSFCWDFFVKKKLEVPMKAERLLLLLTNNGYNVKYLQCDDAGEHGEALKLICVKFGVQPEMTGQGCLKRNGKVERRFVTNGEQATAALIAAELPEQDRKHL